MSCKLLFTSYRYSAPKNQYNNYVFTKHFQIAVVNLWASVDEPAKLITTLWNSPASFQIVEEGAELDHSDGYALPEVAAAAAV